MSSREEEEDEAELIRHESFVRSSSAYTLLTFSSFLTQQQKYPSRSSLLFLTSLRTHFAFLRALADCSFPPSSHLLLLSDPSQTPL